MILNIEQQEALRGAVERYKAKELYTYIAGAAGTGKSTLVQHIVAALGLDPEEDVCYVAYTGKAAQNLKRKGCPNACTLHSLLYHVRINKKTGVPFFVPKYKGEIKFKLIVVDEISMVTQDMWDLLVMHHNPMILLGDIHQLPAIGVSNNVMNDPHYVLTEIMRQEADSEIIQVATLARNHQPIPYMKGEQVQVIPYSEYVDAMADWADITLCATNKKRQEINRIARERLWGAPDLPPQKGDKIICLHNEWDCKTELGDVLINGLVGFIYSDPIIKDAPLLYQRMIEKTLHFDFIPDYRLDDELINKAIFRNTPADYKLLQEGTPTVTQKNYRSFPKVLMPKQFDYAYAVTCHKAQGSEYNKVLVLEEGFPFGEKEHFQWLYTACTRAIDKLVIVRN